jgi:hypothetical protein
VAGVYGDCGDDRCPLFGHSFLSWRSDPADAFSLLADDEGVARFRASGAGTILGREPARGADLVEAAIEVVPISEARGFVARAIPIDDGAEEPSANSAGRESFTLPGNVPQGTTLILRLEAERDAAEAVLVSHHDIDWQIDGPLTELTDHEAGLIGAVFRATAPGLVTLEADTPLFAETPQFALTVE